MTKSTHGGARKGAGRPHAGNRPYNVRLRPDTMARIRSLATISGKTSSQIIQEILEKSLAQKK